MLLGEVPRVGFRVATSLVADPIHRPILNGSGKGVEVLVHARAGAAGGRALGADAFALALALATPPTRPQWPGPKGKAVVSIPVTDHAGQ